MTSPEFKSYIEAQKARMVELRAEMDSILKESRERVEAENSNGLFVTCTMSSLDVASWPNWMKSESLKRVEEGKSKEPEPPKEVEDDTFPCLRCKTGRMVDLGDGRSGYCPNCDTTVTV